MRDDHVEAKVAATNQLGALLETHWPRTEAIFAWLDSQIALDFLERYPTAQGARRLGKGLLVASCTARATAAAGRYPSCSPACGKTPSRPLALDPEGIAELVRAQVKLLGTLSGTIADLDRALAAGVLGHGKAHVLTPLPRIGELNVAQKVAEIGRLLERAASVKQAAAEIGAAPVTRTPGEHRAVCFRFACNTKARKALATFADNSRHASPWAAAVYQRARGDRRPHAPRIFMRAGLWLMWARWDDGHPYQPSRHRGIRRLAPEGAKER